MALRIASSAAGADYLPAGIHGNGPAVVPPRVPRSIIPPASVQENAWLSASPAMLLTPTTWPFSFTARFAEAAAEGAQVDHPSGFRPGECMAFGIASSAADADHLARSRHVLR